jgi:hypothetical protein
MKRRNDSASKSSLSNIEGALAALNAEDLRNLIRAMQKAARKRIEGVAQHKRRRLRRRR